MDAGATKVVVVGGGFAGVACAKAEVSAVDPEAMSVNLDTGETLPADCIVLAAGAEANFFRTPGADEHTFPLYSVDDARRVRGRIVQLFEDAVAKPELIDEGALTFVVVGGGPTGVETAGALGELIHNLVPHVYKDAPPGAAQVILVDLGHSLLAAFSEGAGAYAAKQLHRRGVKLQLGVPVKEVTADHVALADGSVIKTRLGSVAQQAGRWAGENILALSKGRPAKPFHYRDKGIMAMIGRKAAVAEVGAHRHEIHGRVAFAAWLGVHAELLGNIGAELKAFVAWAEEFYVRPHHRSADLPEPSRIDMPRIDWGQKG